MRVLFTILYLITVLSCKDTKKQIKYLKSEISRTNYTNKEGLIQQILDLPKWQWVYHSDVPGKLPVKILKNNIVDDTMQLYKFNQKLLFLSLQELEAQKLKGYIEVKELRLHFDTVNFKIEYQTEGAFAIGQFVMKNNNWVLDNYSIGEY